MRAGVIGIGSMGFIHARVYADMGVLAGVSDLDVKSGNTVASRFSARYYESAGELMNEVDAVSIATPTFAHYDMVKMAIDKGIHILVEKPFTGDPVKAEELCRRAEDAGVTLAVGMVERHNPVVAVVKERLERGDYGSLTTFSSRRVSSMPARIRDVGVIMDLGIHDVDVFNYLCGSRINSVYAVGGSSNSSGFEDHANIVMEAENGVKGMVEVNWLTPMKVRSVSLTCSKLFAEFDYMTQSVSTSSSRYSNPEDESFCFDSPWEFDHRRFSVKKEEPLRRELEDFLVAAKSGVGPLVTGWDVLEDLRVCMAALRSIRESRAITL